MKNSLAYQTNQLLLSNKISIDREELYFQIESHPSYPSLHAITGVLTHFNIDNVAVEVPPTSETLQHLPKSFLALIGSDSHKEFVLVEKKDPHIIVHYSNGKKKTQSSSEFLKKFSGVIVAVEKGEFYEEQKEKKRCGQKLLPILPAVLFPLLFHIFSPSFSAMAHFAFAVMGALISYILIQEENGIETPIGNALCSGASEKKDCKAVTNSKGATILGLWKMSVLSFFYFLTVAISGFIVMLFQPNLGLQYAISLAVTPIILYSLFYQYFVIKKWCTLCLGILLILASNAAISYTNISSIDFILNVKEIFAIVTGIAITAIIVTWVFPIPILVADLKKSKIEFFKFKRNFNLFNNLLNQSNVIDTHIPDSDELVYGNSDALLKIIILTNPFCGFCKSVHTQFENILRKYALDVSLTIRLNVNANNLNDRGTIVGLRLLELHHQKDKLKCLEAMHEIYNHNNSEEWLTKWGECEDSSTYLKTLVNGNNWCIKNELNFTPVILIDGKSYPHEYDRTELTYFIEELVSHKLQDKNLT